MLEDVFFLALLFVIFTTGPVTSTLGVYRHSVALSLAGCILCWLVYVFCLVGSIAIVFNPVSIVPVLTTAFVSTVGWVMVMIGARQQKTS
ncbi:hypothetical protein HY413_00700 [Candidatus Kaiserbacteria bacterium]|nr:hypothetical protein [Candidatus Kaiserbacteria bacterium]